MGRKVFVTSEMSIDERLAEVAEDRPDLALLWPWFLTAFDDWGRAEAQPRRLKLKVFPMIGHVTADTVAEAIAVFARSGLILRYTVDQHEYMAIPADKWFRYQTHIHKNKRDEDKSRFPAPPPEIRSTCAEFRDNPRERAEISGNGTQNVLSPSLSLSKRSTTTPRETAQDCWSMIEAGWFTYLHGTLSATAREELPQYLEGDRSLPPEVILCAFQEADRNSARTWSYVSRILDAYRAEGVTTVAEAQARAADFAAKKERPRNGKSPPDPRSLAALYSDPVSPEYQALGRAFLDGQKPG